jgi:hypothetical protein
MELVIIVAYAAILALVAPFIVGRSNNYGSWVPFGLATVSGALLFLIFTWVGLSYEQAWIWFGVMLGMPTAVFVGVRLIEARRLSAEAAELDAIRAAARR